MSLSLSHINKAFGEQVVLSDFSYEFSDTGLYCLTGESGRGKTTLMRVIAGLDTDYTGTVTGGGDCSYLFQDRRLFPTLTALDNVVVTRTCPRAERQAVRTAARDLLLSMHLTEGDIRKKPAGLSGGMQQRLAIARALFYRAPILLLDEPTKELDPANKATVAALIAEESKHRLVILATHEAGDPAAVGATFLSPVGRESPGT